MPKTRDTRKDKASELLRRSQKGPEFILGFPRTHNDPTWRVATEEAKAAYRGWAASWLIPLLYDLVPEFKGMNAIDASLERASRAGKARS